MNPKIIKQIAASVGPEQVLTAAEDRWPYAFDATDLDHLPDAVVFPGSAAEVVAIVHSKTSPEALITTGEGHK